MKKRVAPLDPSRMRLRRPGEREAIEIAEEAAERFGNGEEGAEEVLRQLALEESKFSTIH